ncbi:GNAT family N-acetyltransferase [Colwellia sp. RSH04]|uniref:GNAT family N-acetyltransferase n=1 Tax=Colwellia sp. RSH04 TaxID=2305464 RepID=UPI000E58952E|nr:GNAT family N-acetyltransferase [Colwellia sp. RSH04]RHW77996.1 GNAT family N-acetyltransferase [Colwellia sp. RSH04]
MPSNLWANRVSQRTAMPSDIPFMRSLYAATRASELAMTNFTEQEKQVFIEQQFNAQYAHYNQHYCSDFFNIIELDGVAIGRLFVDYWQEEIRIVDILLATEFQNNGLGTFLFNDLFKQAKKVGKAVTIHVEQNNPAKRLYERLGFSLKTKTNEVYLLMEWLP